MAGPFSAPPRPGAADGTVGGPSLAVGGNNAGGGPAGGVVNQVNFQQLIKAIQQLAEYTKQSLGAAASGDLSGIYPGPISVVSTHLTNPLPLAQGGTGNTTGQPSGAAGGDLSGNYPDPTVIGVHLSAPLPVSQGGTGLTSGTSGGILAFSAGNALVSSGLLAQYELVLGGGAGVAPSTLGSLGTTVTVYHGNATGAGAFGPVALTTDVSGVLPLTNGGTGAALTGTTGTGNLVLSASPTFTGTTLMAALTLSGEELVTSLDGITALAGGGRTGSPVLSAQLNRVAIVASASDSVQLPAAVAGDFRAVINDGAHAMQIFGNGGDTIDGTAGATGVPLTNAKRALFFCTTTGHWYSLSGPVSS